MQFLKLFLNLILIFSFLCKETFFIFPSYAAFDVQGIELFKDGNICIIMAGSTTSEALNLANLQTNQESAQSKVTSSGAFCPIPPFFTGGAILNTTNGISTQADPTVQGLGRGILISEIAGDSGGVSSSGDPSGFSSLVTRLGGLTMTLFEISLPTGCDVIDDDDDIVGASSDLSTVNDFSLPTCTSTNGLTVQCNAVSNLLTAASGLVAASGSTPAKLRFTISDINTSADGNMIDSILIGFDSQDIFCSNTASAPLTATIIAKNAVDSPTISETIGTFDLGTPTQAAKISYVKDNVISLKGETSTNEVSTTPLLIDGSSTLANKLQIEELNNESIPISGQSSANLINPSVSSNAENNIINLWLTLSSVALFSNPPLASDITFSDNSLIVNSAPYIVKSNSDDLNAPFGTLVIPIRKNDAQGATNPSTVKTTITIQNLTLASANSSSKDSSLSLAFFEPLSGAVVNTPGGLSINNSTNPNNPQNFASFSAVSTRALAQNAVVSGAVNDATAALQVTTDTDLAALTTRDTTLGTPQIIGFTKVVSAVTPLDVSKISISNTNSVLTVTASTGASIGGARLKIDSFANGSMSAHDSTTIITKSDGSFVSNIQADFSSGDVTLNFKETVSNTDSTVVSKIFPKPSSSSNGGNLTCDKTVCGCTNVNCTPTITLVLNFVQTNGGLSQVITKGGDTLDELIKSAKKALGLS